MKGGNHWPSELGHATCQQLDRLLDTLRSPAAQPPPPDGDREDDARVISSTASKLLYLVREFEHKHYPATVDEGRKRRARKRLQDYIRDQTTGEPFEPHYLAAFETGLNPASLQFTLIGLDLLMFEMRNTERTKGARKSHLKRWAVSRVADILIRAGHPVNGDKSGLYCATCEALFSSWGAGASDYFFRDYCKNK